MQHSVGAAIWDSLLIALNESKGGFTLLYKGNSIEKDEYSIMQNTESANILSRLIKAFKDSADRCMWIGWRHLCTEHCKGLKGSHR